MILIIALLLLIGIVFIGSAVTGTPPVELFRHWTSQ